MSFSLFAQSNYLRQVLSVTSPRMYGEDVFFIQKKIVEMGFEIGEVDGYYGPKTEKAVKSFKDLAGFEPDGIIAKTEYDFFDSKEAEVVILGIAAWNENKNAETVSYKSKYKIPKSPNGKFYVYKKEGKTAFCKLEISGDSFLQENKVFKINENTFFICYEEKVAENLTEISAGIYIDVYIF
ncbi:MAG: peptidoglycan-binding protein [Treponemataceae bacterium]|nr:peptidoglycan-binding protein [Treponemataceae bacterium]